MKTSTFIAVLAALLLLGPSTWAQPVSSVQGAQSMKAYLRGTTPALSTLTPVPATAAAKVRLRKDNRPDFTPPNFINWKRQPKANPLALPKGMDPLLQQAIARSQNDPLPIEPELVIEGINEITAGAGVPDTNGDVSPDHYIQIVNASWFQIFAKDGTPLTDPLSANTLWQQIGRQSLSDPIILFDEDASRWVITDLYNIDGVLYGISQTEDPMGAWNLYEFQASNWMDYPKYGIFPNAYVLTVNQGFGGYPVYLFNRQQMIDGASEIDIQRIELPSLDGGFPTATPMSWSGLTPPPTDEAFVLRLNDDAWGNGNGQDLLELWAITIDWANPGAAQATLQALPTTPYDSDGCAIGSGFSFACVPQPGTTQGIDGIMTIVMTKAPYRNFGGYESAVLTFSINAGDEEERRAGIRWMELRRNPGQDWLIHQEGSFAPQDSLHRFIGAISLNARGDIGLGYSVSGTEYFPSLRFTGRRASDPLGEMTVAEYEFATGAGVRGSDRYGDYASMSVDPIDDAFWFTSEYVRANGSYGTSIVKFSLGRDTFDLGVAALESPSNAPLLAVDEAVVMRVRNFGLTPIDSISLGYVFEDEAPVVEQVAFASPLLPDSAYTHTFATTVDLSTIGTYTFKIFASYAEDQNVRNDTLVRAVRHLPRLDAGITDAAGLEQTLCGDTAGVVVKLTNLGTDTLFSAAIIYQLNDGPELTESWTGSLPSGTSAEVPLLLAGLAEGANTFQARSDKPNAQADEIPENDGYARGFSVILEGRAVSLSLQLDGWPDETSWQLQDETGQVLFTGGPYNSSESQSNVIEPFCLEDERCYTFTIFDFFGDGLEDPLGPNGSYEITDEAGNVLAAILQTNFGSQERNQFCISDSCSLLFELDAVEESNTGSGDGVILVTVLGGVPPFAYSLDGGATFQDGNIFENLSGGTYQLMVRGGNDCLIEQTIELGTIVSTRALPTDYRIAVAPNPSATGAFALTVEGAASLGGLLDYQVMDGAGRPVLYGRLPSVGRGHEGVLSLRAFPAGVYYLRFRHPDIRQLLKLVRL